MKHGIFLPPFNELADPRRVAALAADAEQAGWDGFYVWDHVLAEPGMAVAEAWTTLAAIAMATSHIRIGALVTPLARRRPWVLARQIAMLDQLSGGRLVVGVGLGDDGWREFSAFGDETVPRVRGELLDESLQILQGLLTGNEVVHAGGRYVIDCPPLLPAPVQDPVPIWAAVRWPNRKPLARAARLQGCFPIFAGSGDRPAPPPAGPGVIPPVAGVPELLPARDHRPGQHADDRPPGRHRLGAGVGRRSAYSPRTSCRCRSPVISIGRRPAGRPGAGRPGAIPGLRGLR